MNRKNTIAIVTTILDDWGGSEELWAKSIPFLKEGGAADITVYKRRINSDHPKFLWLKAEGVKLKELLPEQGISKKIGEVIKRIAAKFGLGSFNEDRAAERFYNDLKAAQPDLVIISQAINFDGLHLAQQCLKLKIPYVIVCQKAVDFFWPDPPSRGFMKETLLGARQCFFVSQHNKTLTEEQFGTRLRKSQIIFNPVKTSASGAQPYPDASKGFRLACVGRLFVIDKGQDILLRILSQPKWQERHIEVSFIGTGPDMKGIKEMAALLAVKKVIFKGQINDIEQVWAEHHALILPSRSEGLPLVITEAMAAGRIAITTNAGGNAEVIKHGIDGFIGEANENDFDNAMEQAWAKREEWQQMGQKAAENIKQIIPPLPERDFAVKVMQLIGEQ